MLNRQSANGKKKINVYIFVCVCPQLESRAHGGFLQWFPPGCRVGCWWKGFNSTNHRHPHSPIYGATFITHFNSFTLTWPQCLLRMQHTHRHRGTHTFPTCSHLHLSVPNQCLLLDPHLTLHLIFYFMFNYLLVSRQEAPRSQYAGDVCMCEVQLTQAFLYWRKQTIIKQ